MKVLLLTQYFRPEVGAAQTRLDALTAHLDALGDEVEVVTALPNYPEGRILPGYRRTLMRTTTEAGVRVHRIWMYAAMGTGLKRLASYLSFTASSVLGLVRSRKPDLVIVESPPLFLAATAVAYGMVRRVPVVMNVADLWPDAAVEVGALSEGRVLSFAHWLERHLYRRCAAISTVTDGVRDRLLEKGVPAAKVVMLPNGVDTDRFAPDAGDPAQLARLGIPEGPFIVYAGTIGLAHGIDPLIDAMKLVANEAGPVLVIIGSGSERPRIERRIATEAIGNVMLHDPISPEELAAVLPLASAAIVTLADIPLNRSVRPAKMPPLMAAGVPVVFAGSGEGAELLRSADAGIVVPNEASAIAEAILELHRDPDLRRRLGGNGRHAALTRWSWPSLIAPWRAEVRAILGRS